jgi:drug/metabolite transporter, DME family
LRTVSPQEAAIITLIEPLLNPVWAYLLTPEKDTPNVWMWAGGGLILLALVWRYVPPVPRHEPSELAVTSTESKADRETEGQGGGSR